VAPEGEVSIGCGKTVPLPIRYFDLASFSGRFLADAAAVRAALPTERLTPLEAVPGRAVVHIVAFDYRRSDLGPYREFAVWFPVTETGSEAQPGLYCHLMPLTSEPACIAGIEGWGFPKFLSEVAINTSAAECRCRVAADEREIATLVVSPTASVSPLAETVIDVYTRQRDELLHCKVHQPAEREQRAGEGSALLALGEHPRAEALRQLEIDPEGVAHAYVPHRRLILYGPDRREPL
jgi:hypothetical protein